LGERGGRGVEGEGGRGRGRDMGFKTEKQTELVISGIHIIVIIRIILIISY
jgi:hypothetical protein